MHQFWESVIKPIIIATQPKIIVEIGSFTGLNTFRILEYCKLCHAECIIIDPKPQYDTHQVRTEYKGQVKFIKKYSLDALPKIHACDLVLIDGDHNWYTVYHELKHIERIAIKSGRFPIILLHDVGWPYGRRDMYYFPESIPEPFRKPYAQKGMLQGQSELLEHGGLNDFMFNAVHEHGEQNGVLTAVEDYMKQNALPLQYYELQSNNGLGMIVPQSSIVNAVLPYIMKTSML